MLLFLSLLFRINFGEEVKLNLNENKDSNFVQSLTLGSSFGGSFLGLDYEHLIYNNIGFQFGYGAIGLDFAINYHFKSIVNSSAVSLCYWNSGYPGKDYSSRSVGLEYIIRKKKKWFGFNTYKVGLRYVLSYNQEIIDAAEESNQKLYPVQITLGFGIYWKETKIDWSRF